MESGQISQGLECHTAGCLRKFRQLGLGLISKIPWLPTPFPPPPNPFSRIREEVKDLLPRTCPHPGLMQGQAGLSPLPGRCRCGWAALISGPLEPLLSL